MIKKETQSIIYCIRINKTLHRAIHKKATNKKIKPSTLIRELLMDKFIQSRTNEGLKVVESTVFEQHEFKGWLITIENYRGTDELYGFATPTKYAHLLNADNYYYMDEIAQENGIESNIDEYGDMYYKDFNFVIAEPDDVVVNFLAGVNTKSASCVLDYMENEIIREMEDSILNNNSNETK